MKLFVIMMLLSVFASNEVTAQMCFPQQGPGFVAPAPAYSGGHFQNQSLLAPAQAFQPQEYYFPQGNVQLSQPPLFGGGMQCQPGFMNRPFQTSFGQGQMQPPSFMQMALPHLGKGLSGLADYFEDRPRPRGQSYDEFISERDGSSQDGSSPIDNESFYSPGNSDAPSAIPDSNSAGASGQLNPPQRDTAQEPVEEEEPSAQDSEPEPEEEDTPAQETQQRSASEDDAGIDLSDEGSSTIPIEEVEIPYPDTIPEQPVEDRLEDAVTQVADLPAQAQAPLTKEGCMDLIREQGVGNSPLQGAFRVMATFYQDCESLTKILNKDTPLPSLNVSIEEDMNKIKTRRLEPQNRENYFAEHPYLKGRDFEQVSEQCRDLRDAPPIFSYGAKPRYKGGAGGDIDLFRNQADAGICKYSNVDCDSPPVTALDCSGFIHSALKASGLKIEKGQEHPNYSTIALNDIAMKENTCLDELSFSAEQTLAPGDIISQSNHHTFMISGVGEDPLGVKKGIEAQDCSSISRSDFDFTFIQSGASRSIGVAHLSSDYPEVSTTIFNNLMAMAHETCERALAGEGRLRATTRNGRSSMVVMRHVGESDPECVEESKPELEGEECVEDCLNES